MDTKLLHFLKRRDSDAGLPLLSIPMDQLRFILSLPPESRNNANLAFLAAATKTVKFYADIRDKYGEFTHCELCRYVMYQENMPGDFVFSEGDEGSCFYTITSGSCAVITRKKGEKLPRLLAILRVGEGFGELAMLVRKPRAASVLCREICSFLVLERTDFLTVIEHAKQRSLDETLKLLQHHLVFGLWPLDALKMLSKRLKVQFLWHKQVLFAAGQTTKSVYLVKSGSFQLTKETVRYQQVKGGFQCERYPKEVRLVGMGEMLGIGNLQSGKSTWDTTCVCVSTEAEVCVISTKDFLSLAKGSMGALVMLDQRRNVTIKRAKILHKPYPYLPGLKPASRHSNNLPVFNSLVNRSFSISRDMTPSPSNLQIPIMRSGSLPELSEENDSFFAMYKQIQRI